MKRLLSKSATDENIQNASQKMQDMSQDRNELETDHFARFMRQHNFCRNCLDPAALRSTFINSLQPRPRYAVNLLINIKRDADPTETYFNSFKMKE